MPKGRIPEELKDLFDKKAFANLVTLMPDGSPQVTPVWCDYDGQHVIGELGIAPDEVTLPPPPAMPRMQRRESASGQRGYGIGMLPPQSGASSIRVVQVIDGGVAQRCGVRAGDRIVSIDGKAVSELEQGELRGLMRQSPLVLEIERDGEQLEFELSLD